MIQAMADGADDENVDRISTWKPWGYWTSYTGLRSFEPELIIWDDLPGQPADAEARRRIIEWAEEHLT
jgi:hypothetical protein